MNSGHSAYWVKGRWGYFAIIFSVLKVNITDGATDSGETVKAGGLINPEAVSPVLSGLHGEKELSFQICRQIR
ncbi:hypothetical protein ENC22_05405 [Hahella sp. KA22]|nr:hypothetical protein ENC22_05405 [Hahella sp. KA22]